MAAIMSSRAFAPYRRAGAWLPLIVVRRGARRAAAAASRPGRSPEAADEQPDVMPSATEAAPPGTQAQDREDRVRGRRFPGVWPLLAVLVVQAALSLRLVRADTAYQSEALYLHAGHLEWAHWLHGAVIPPFASYFSGAPVIYPPVGAVADSLGGLVAARVLSLMFMLGATALLWGAASRLFGRQAAFFSAALFALLGTTLHLGAFATNDAMAVFLVALAAWCVVQAGDRGPATGWMVAAAVALALANAAAYSSMLFDLVVALLALLTAPRASGGLLAARRVATLLIVTAALLAVGLLAGGSTYVAGIKLTTLTRIPGSAAPLSVFANSWYWSGLLLVLALCGVVFSWAGKQPATQTLLLAVLFAAAVIGPLEQAHLHTEASLYRHIGLGSWFAAIAAGYALDRFITAASARRARAFTAGACVVALVFPAGVAFSQSWSLSANWPNATGFITIFRPLVDHSTGPVLVEDPSIAEYYTLAGAQWQRWSSTRNIVLTGGINTGNPSTSAGVTGAGDASIYARYIKAGYFTLVALNFTDTTGLDQQLAADLRSNHSYHKIQVVPYGSEIAPIGLGSYIIWRYEPTTRAAG
jgi:Dolichyl-phosphate-mannose-protein mannosyltransferase